LPSNKAYSDGGTSVSTWPFVFFAPRTSAFVLADQQIAARVHPAVPEAFEVIV
jgi:hypothetical protein